ncbi:MAG: pentapeptide repeat-containing protein [Nostoc sp.]|uniref:pentapeptide repeat-containing protein n=1 Tax=Nostoc sp. TaxID=1180 RepID=UPI002FF4AABA
MSGANFSNANLDNANLSDATLNSANLSDTSLNEAKIVRANLTKPLRGGNRELLTGNRKKISPEYRV